MWPLRSLLRTSHVNTAIGICLRLPGLLIIDWWWQHERNKALPHSISARDIFDALLTNIVLLHGFLLLLLPLKKVQALYTHFVSFSLLLSANLISYFYIHRKPDFALFPQSSSNEVNKDNFLTKQLMFLGMQVLLATTASFLLRGPGKPHVLLLNAFNLPLFAKLLNVPQDSLEIFHNIGSTIVAASVTRYIYFQIPEVAGCLKEAYHDAIITVNEVNGWTTLLVGVWNKLFVANHFLVFWLCQFTIKIVGEIMQNSSYYHKSSGSLGEEWYILVISIVSSICSSPVSLLATAVTVSHLSGLVLKGTKCFLIGQLPSTAADLDEINSSYSGWTEGLTLVLFAIQTGLMEMRMPSKMAVMIIILFIDLSTLLQSMLEMVEPVLLSLGTNRSRSIGFKRMRVFSLCAFLFCFPLYLTYLFIQLFSIDFWMIILLSSCLLTSFQVIDLLIVHFLFVYDAWRTEPWDILDDVVYYTRAFTKILEFLVALFVVAVGLIDSPSDGLAPNQTKWNWANSTIILVHCYVNVWQRLVAGWQSFNLRRKAAQRTISLPSANSEILKEKNDLCSICFVEMTVNLANNCCETPCHHFFHRACLRKWLYIRNACPLCHAAIS